MDCSSSEPLEYQQSEEYRLHELSSIVENTLKPKNCENKLKLNNSIQNVNSGPSHTSINPAIQLTKRNVLRDNTNTHHLRQKTQSKDEEKENRITEVFYINHSCVLRNQYFHSRPKIRVLILSFEITFIGMP